MSKEPSGEAARLRFRNAGLSRFARFCRPETVIFLGLWLLLMVAGRSRLFHDPGTFSHTRIGQQILETGRVTDADTFSFTFQGKPWVACQWLAECGMAIIYRTCGWDGLLLASVTLLAALYTWVAARLLRAGLHLLCVLLVIALVLSASAHHFHVRPLILTIALTGVTFALLVEVDAGRVKLRSLWGLVPIYVLWTNVHGGVIGGLGTLGLVILGWCVAALLGRHSPLNGPRQAMELIALLAVCLLTVLINPYALELPKTWITILRLPLPHLIKEHAPLYRSGGIESTMILLLGAAYVVAVAGIFPKRLRITWLVPLVWFALGCGRIRHAPLFAIIAAIALADLLPHTRWAAWLARRDLFRFSQDSSDERPRRFDWRLAVVPSFLVSACLLLQFTAVPIPILGHQWAHFDRAYWPVDLVAELRQLDRDSPEKIRIFNEYRFGGFLIFYTPRLEVFVDDRCELYGREFLETLDHAQQEDPLQLEVWATRYGIQYALTVTNSPLDRYLQGACGWTLIKRTQAATLYRRSALESLPARAVVVHAAK